MDIIEKEKQLASYSGEDKVISSYDMERIVDNMPQLPCHDTGLVKLDGLLEGVESGEVVVVSGVPGDGKTLLVQTLIRNFAEKGKKSLVFSYEVVPRNFLRVFKDNLPLFYLPSALKTENLDWLSERAWESKLKHDTRIVFIDHLHFLIQMQSRANLSLSIGVLMRTLKSVAKKHNLVIFLVAHTTKTNQDRELEMGDLRDSGMIAAEADTVLMVWRTKTAEAPNASVLKVVKNRRCGTLGKIEMFKAPDGFLQESYGKEVFQADTERGTASQGWNTDV